MRIDYEGQSYDFDMADITVKQAIKIEKHLGCPVAEFGSRLFPEGENRNPDMLALQCLGWLILHGGRGIPIEDTDFSVTRLFAALSAAAVAEKDAADSAADAAAANPVPTVAADPSANGAMTAAGPLSVP